MKDRDRAMAVARNLELGFNRTDDYEKIADAILEALAVENEQRGALMRACGASEEGKL